jgi:uncharacterized protein YacL
MTEPWRVIVIGILLLLSVIDIISTFYYINKYKKWQPNKPYNLIENNPLLVILWNQLGLIAGTIIGALIIWTLIFIVGKTAHPIVIGIVFLMLIYALFNHYTNIGLLHQLIEKYPSGYLPSETFGIVEGNNLK